VYLGRSLGCGDAHDCAGGDGQALHVPRQSNSIHVHECVRVNRRPVVSDRAGAGRARGRAGAPVVRGGVSLAGFALMLRWKVEVVPLIAAAAALGIVRAWASSS